MTTDLTPEELAGLRERVANYIFPPDQVQTVTLMVDLYLRLVAMAARRIPGGDVLAGDLTRALQERDAMAKRAARYREALLRELCGDHDNNLLPLDAPCRPMVQEGPQCTRIRAALAEPEEAQHGDD